MVLNYIVLKYIVLYCIVQYYFNSYYIIKKNVLLYYMLLYYIYITLCHFLYHRCSWLLVGSEATFRSGFGWFCLLRIEVPESNVRHGSPSQRSHSVLQQDGTQSQLCCLTRTGWDSILFVLLDKNSLGLNRMCVA